jgi:hypothetical protein
MASLTRRRRRRRRSPRQCRPRGQQRGHAAGLRGELERLVDAPAVGLRCRQVLAQREVRRERDRDDDRRDGEDPGEASSTAGALDLEVDDRGGRRPGRLDGRGPSNVGAGADALVDGWRLPEVRLGCGEAALRAAGG